MPERVVPSGNEPTSGPEMLAQASRDFVDLYWTDNTFRGLRIVDKAYEAKLTDAWNTFSNKYPSLENVASQFKATRDMVEQIYISQGELGEEVRKSYATWFSHSANDAKDILTDILIARTNISAGSADYTINHKDEVGEMLKEIGSYTWGEVTAQQVAEAVLSGRLRFTHKQAPEA